MWYSVLHIWTFCGPREIHRHDIRDVPTIGDAIRWELQIGSTYGPDTLAIVPTNEADEIAKVFCKKLGLRYTTGNGTYPHEEQTCPHCGYLMRGSVCKNCEVASVMKQQL